MAAPITHIALAQKYLDVKKPAIDRKSFFIGVSFPDIRYYKKVIARNQTHARDVTPEMLASADDFRAGVLFHAFTDQVQERYMRSAGLFEIVPPTISNIHALKFLEDELSYPKLSDWDAIAGYFDTIEPGELAYPIAEKDIRAWHETTKAYCSMPPSVATRRKLSINIDFTDQQIAVRESEIEMFRKDPRILKILEDFSAKFPELIL